MNKNKKFQSSNAITISFAHFTHDLYTSFLAPMLPLLINKFGISLSMAGFLDVARKFPALFNPFIGVMADKTSIRYFVIFTPLITGIAMSLLGVAPSYSVILILLFVVGISSAVFHIPSPVMIKNVSGNKTGKGMSYFMLGGEIARTLGPLLITASITIWGLEGSYKVMLLAFISTIFLYIKLKDIEVNKSYKKKNIEFSPKDTFKKLIPFFIIITGIALFRSSMKAAITLYLPTFLTSNGKSLWLAGISLSILQLSGAVGTFLAGSISDKIGRKYTLLITAIANPILMWAFIILNDSFMIPILILIGFFLFASGPVLLALVHDTDSEHPAFVNSIYMTINFVMSSLMVLLVGFLGDKIGLIYTYKICAILAAGSIPFILFLPKSIKQKHKRVSSN
ncbi:MAG: MFS transporter [Candidatus Marinimicrobia bacterium]|nr:MFS transporter [Candidatus Neomarinimicrobiota bacterium]